MSIYFLRFLPVLFFGSALLAAVFCTGINTSVKSVAAKSDDSAVISKQVVSPTPPITAKGEQTAVFAGGCFWGVEAVFEHVKGVSDVTSGYSGGTAKTANYEMVSEVKLDMPKQLKSLSIRRKSLTNNYSKCSFPSRTTRPS